MLGKHVNMTYESNLLCQAMSTLTQPIYQTG